MIPVEPTNRCSRRRPRFLGFAFIVASLLCLPAGAAPTVRRQANRQSGEIEPATPTVSVQVVAPAATAPGKGFTYRIVAENVSDAPAHHVYVKATLSRSAKAGRTTPAGEVVSPEGAPAEKATVVTWNLGTLSARGRREMSLAVKPTGEDEVTCIARVQFEHGQSVRTRIEKPDLAPVAPLPGPPPSSPRTSAPATVARPRVPKEKEEAKEEKIQKVEKERKPPGKPALRLSQTPPSVALLPPNETFTYKYEVTNVGTAPAKDVVVEATPAKGLDFLTSKPSTPGTTPVVWKFPEIAPGATERVEYSVAGAKVGPYVNRAVVTADGGLAEKVEHEVRIGQPKLVVVVTGPAQRAALREAIYHITVKNTGDAPALDVELSDEPIKDEKVSDAVKAARPSDGGKIAGNVVRWSLGTVAPGRERTVSVVLQAKGAGEFTYLCTARSKDLVEQGRVRTKFTEPASLEIELDRLTNATTLKVGTELRYGLRLRNGGAKENTDVDVLVIVPDGLELLEPQPVPGSPATKTDIRLARVLRLTPTSGRATLRFRTTKAGVAKLSLKAVSAQTGPDEAARLEEVVTVGE